MSWPLIGLSTQKKLMLSKTTYKLVQNGRNISAIGVCKCYKGPHWPNGVTFFASDHASIQYFTAAL